MSFRDRLLATVIAARPVLETPGVLVVGSEVPNLLEVDAAATLVVSQDLDIGVPVAAHADLKTRLPRLRGAFHPSPEEPSVWLPSDPHLLELNFVGIDPAQEPSEAYLLEDPQLPLLVFGSLSLIHAGRRLEIGGTPVPLPLPAGLILEKLVSDRTGEKGERDLLVALALLESVTAADLDEFERAYAALPAELRHAVRSNLTILSLLAPRSGMPDPRPRRGAVAALLSRLELVEPAP